MAFHDVRENIFKVHQHSIEVRQCLPKSMFSMVGYTYSENRAKTHIRKHFCPWVWLKLGRFSYALWLMNLSNFWLFFRLWKLKSRPEGINKSKNFMGTEMAERHHKWFDFHITREIHRISNVKNQLITTLSYFLRRRSREMP